MSPSIGFFWWNTEVCCCCRGWTHLLSSFTASFSKIDRRYCLDLSNAINRLGTRNIRLARAELLNPFARADIPLQGFRKGSLTLNRMMEEASMEQQHWKKCRCPNFDTLSIRIFKWTNRKLSPRFSLRSDLQLSISYGVAGDYWWGRWCPNVATIYLTIRLLPATHIVRLSCDG